MEFSLKNIYEPEEDSKLLLKNSLHEIKFSNIGNKNLKILEIGVGSGFVISNIAKELKDSNEYYGCDINQEAIDYTKNEFKKINQKINIKKSDLLKEFNKKFDIILFNTPYFPFENKEDTFEKLSLKDRAIYGGKKGYETIENLIYKINDKLNNNGFCILIFSSLTNLEYIQNLLKDNFFEYKILEEENSFFEKIICLKFEKSDTLKSLSKKLTKIKYLAKGKHSTNLEGIYENKKAILKIGKEQHIIKEINFLKKLENENFTPKIYFYEEEFVCREMFEGTLITDFFKKGGKKEIEEVINKILIITQRLDKLKINKFEMTNPYKHIYILENLDVKMIDYERCIFSENPKNTTQVLEFFKRWKEVLKEKGINLDEKKIRKLSEKYKENHFKIYLNDITSS